MSRGFSLTFLILSNLFLYILPFLFVLTISARNAKPPSLRDSSPNAAAWLDKRRSFPCGYGGSPYPATSEEIIPLQSRTAWVSHSTVDRYTLLLQGFPLEIGLFQLLLREGIFARRFSSRFRAFRSVSSFLANWKRIRWFTGSRKKLEPGTAPTPTSRARSSQNFRSLS